MQQYSPCGTAALFDTVTPPNGGTTSKSPWCSGPRNPDRGRFETPSSHGSDAHWRRDEINRAFEFARQLAREASDGKEYRELKEFRKTSFASGVERFAQSDPVFAVTAECWDQNPYLIGTPKGTIELRTGMMRPADPADAITKVTAVGPAADADCPIWMRFLSQATDGDCGMIRFLQQWCGYCLTADTREHALLFLHGPGGNGKSVFQNVVTGILRDYATPAPTETFTVALGDRHPTELAALCGARLVAASETEQGRIWAEVRIKQVTGGDEISARYMRGDFFRFKPGFKLMVVGNHVPKLETVDPAIRRRFNVVPFMHQPETPDPALEEKLRDEWPQIFRWMIVGCLEWQKNGLQRPSRVIAATEDYFSDQDLLGQWLAECCETDQRRADWKESSTELYCSWGEFAKRASEKPGSLKAFSMALGKRIERQRGEGARGFKGIKLKR